ncbi:MAG TPA: glycosyltransferase [Puia sp.]|nr:glycosyltransferase [Puia sp.]
MNQLLVSIVMPVYNGEKYLKEAIDSVLSQTYSNIELLVIDDGSSDASAAIVSNYPDDRVKLIRNEVNSGIVFSRNRGLELAEGEYIATLDADDIALPDRIERQVSFLDTHPEYGLCGTYFRTVDKDGKLMREVRFPTESEDINSYLVLGNCFCASTVMIRANLGKKLRYRESFDIVEDYDLWYRVSKEAKVANLPFCGTYYRVHSGNISTARQQIMYERLKKISVQVLADLKISFLKDELEIHFNFLTENAFFFRSRDRLLQLEHWILRLYRWLAGMEAHNEDVLFRLIVEKWITICSKTANYQKLMLNNLSSINRKVYLTRLCNRTVLKLSGRNKKKYHSA